MFLINILINISIASAQHFQNVDTHLQKKPMF